MSKLRGNNVMNNSVKLRSYYSSNIEAIALLYNSAEENQDELFWEEIKEPFRSILEECYCISEEGKYNQLEQITNSIKYNRISYIKLGVQLYQVKYYRLYKNKYKSFKDYCEQGVYYPVWRANQVIASAGVAIKLIKAGFNIIPQNETQARLLIKLKEEELLAKWQEVLDTYAPHKITANRIEAIVFGINKRTKGTLRLPVKVIQEIENKALESGMSTGELITKIIQGELTINSDGTMEKMIKEKDEIVENPSPESIKRWEKDLNQLAFQERNRLDDFTEELAEELKNTVLDLKQVIKKCFMKSFLSPCMLEN
ncbi:hypothetical protein CSQ80_06480 [Cyanobacterium aponinum IPPAS B-1201]|uniref:Uncharacterized protein n=2 Tax=Cyanobacterium aponinum TaxID=379064 RepID=K9Z2W2_CYAAP|nr:hypothetical protein [Cyanobacterium aponinum]AFZ52920.1 hypothetical protein Cyan10605_0787 [Cyanobacterium aponinum PCC 10605]PHV63175.1 hypothetical protein CSQ80_06480 [Cyanobacterium aponinum IPPAS B-1201]